MLIVYKINLLAKRAFNNNEFQIGLCFEHFTNVSQINRLKDEKQEDIEM